MAGRSASSAAVCHWALVLASLTLCIAACNNDDPVANWSLAAIGAHKAPVGSTWSHEVQSAGAPGAIQWKLRQGPEGMAMLTGADRFTLSWTPTAFDLWPNPPGTPRQAGQPQLVEVIGTDEAGASVTSLGTVQATPAGLASGFDAAANVVLDLAVTRTGRWPVRSDTTALLGAPIELTGQGPDHMELFALSKGVYTLRFRPDDGQLRAAQRYVVRLQATPPDQSVVFHEITIELRNRAAVTPCGGSAPVIRTDLAAQMPAAKATKLSLSLTATDVDSVAARWTIRAGAANGDRQLLPKRGGRLVTGQWTTSASTPATGLLAVSVGATDLDDPVLGRCNRAGKWPRQGWALVGVGPNCADDPPVSDSALPLRPGDGRDRRLCPGAEDLLQVEQAAGAAIAIAVTVPDGWPGVTLKVEANAETLCSSTGTQPVCWLAGADATRVLRVRLDAEKPTSAHLRIRSIEAPCPWQASAKPTPTQLPVASPLSVGLCAGEWRVVTLPQPGLEDAFLLIRSDLPFFEVDELDDQHVALRRWQAETRLDLSEAELPGRKLAVHNPGARSISVQLQWAPAPPPPAPTSRWLPSFQDSLVRLPPKGTGTWALARNPDTAVTLSAQLDEPPIAVAGGTITALLDTSIPWPSQGPPSASTSDASTVIATVAAGIQGLVAMTLRPTLAQGSLVWLSNKIKAPPGCSPDRYEDLNDGEPIRLVPDPQSTVTGQLRLCAQASDAFVVHVPRDGLLEVALLAAAHAPTLQVIGADGRNCEVQTTAAATGPQPARRHASPIRRSARCWAAKSGDVAIKAVAGEHAAIYDLAIRLR